MSKTRTRDLADRLLPWVGMTTGIRDTAVQIEHLARIYSRQIEREASVEPRDDAERERWEAQMESAERRLLNAIGDLPQPWFDGTGEEYEGAGLWALYTASAAVTLIALPPGCSAAETHRYAGRSDLRVSVV